MTSSSVLTTLAKAWPNHNTFQSSIYAHLSHRLPPSTPNLSLPEVTDNEAFTTSSALVARTPRFSLITQFPRFRVDSAISSYLLASIAAEYTSPSSNFTPSSPAKGPAGRIWHALPSGHRLELVSFNNEVPLIYIHRCQGVDFGSISRRPACLATVFMEVASFIKRLRNALAQLSLQFRARDACRTSRPPSDHFLLWFLRQKSPRALQNNISRRPAHQQLFRTDDGVNTLLFDVIGLADTAPGV